MSRQVSEVTRRYYSEDLVKKVDKQPCVRVAGLRSSEPKMKVSSIAIAVLAALLIGVNCRSVQDQFDRPWASTSTNEFESYHSFRWVRGWPITCYVHFGVLPGNPIDQQICTIRLTLPLGLSGQWVADSRSATMAHGLALTTNLLVALMVLLGGRSAIQALYAKPQWAIRTGLFATTIVAVGCAVRGNTALKEGKFHFGDTYGDDFLGISKLICFITFDVILVMLVLHTVAKLPQRYDVRRKHEERKTQSSRFESAESN